MNRISSILFCFVTVLVTPALCSDADEPAIFQMQADVKVDGAGIFLNQIVSSVHATLPTRRLAPAPLLGQTTSLSRQQIIDLAKDDMPELDTTNWSGPIVAHISRRVRQLCEAELLDLLRTNLQKDYVGARGELEIHLSTPWEPVKVPEEGVTLQITDVPTAGVMPNVVVGFELWCGKERVGSWHTPLQSHVWQNIPVAHSPLARGQLLHEADIVLERRDVLTQREACITFPVTDPTLEVNCNIQAGLPIWSRLAHPRSVLRRGQMVDAVFQEGPMTISLKVEALEDGALGQTVRVRNPKTQRVIYGKIQTEDLILIAL